MVTDLFRHRSDLGVEPRTLRINGAHHAATVVAAGRDGIEQRIVKPANDRTQTVFQHPMKLEGLAGGDAQGIAAMRTREFVQPQPLRRRTQPAGQPYADHELVCRFEPLPTAFVAKVTVVLLVDAMELH